MDFFFLTGHMTKIWRTAGKSRKHFLSVEPLHVKRQMETFGGESYRVNKVESISVTNRQGFDEPHRSERDIKQ